MLFSESVSLSLYRLLFYLFIFYIYLFYSFSGKGWGGGFRTGGVGVVA